MVYPAVYFNCTAFGQESSISYPLLHNKLSEVNSLKQ